MPVEQHLRLPAAEFKQFIDDPIVFPETGGYEDAMVFVDGQDSPGGADIALEDLADNATLLICGGRVSGAAPGVPADLIAAVRWWRSQDRKGAVQ